MFKVGDWVVLRPNWKTYKRGKYYACVYIQGRDIGTRFQIADISSTNGKLYFNIEGEKEFDSEHSQCASDPELFLYAMSDQECIDLLYQKMTESLIKPR